MLSDLKSQLSEIKPKIAGLTKHLNLDILTEKKAALEERAGSPELWNNPSTAQKVLQELKNVNDQLSAASYLESKFSDIEAFIELAAIDDDPSIEQQIAQDINMLVKELDKIETSTYLQGEHDAGNAILSINAGAGGTDAQDWAQILLRMYTRWAEEKGMSADLVDLSYGEQAGIKSATMFVRGPYAFGYLKSENGIHRLVRMSPFNSDGKRHTSFAAIEIIPETDDEIKIDINPEDLRTDTFRSSGPGGQNVQKVETAVRITHIPTGIVAACQTDKSQHRNRENAMKLLISRLRLKLEQEQKERLEELKGEQKQIAWGSQIRSYVFAPYQLVKDHRTGAETGQVQKVIDGDLDIFIQAYLKRK